MRKLLTFTLLLPMLCFGQNKEESPYKYFKQDGMKVYFEAIYEVPSVKKDSLLNILISDLSQRQGVINVRAQGDNITADMEGWQFDYKKYGYKLMTVPISYREPFWGAISISTKDDKYKVVVSSIVSNKKVKVETRAIGSSVYDGMFENNQIEGMFLKMNSDKGWATSKSKIKINQEFETELYNLFIIRDKKSDW